MPSPVPPAPTGTLTLGASGSDGAFAPLVDGEDVTLVSGAQGGFHVWLRYRYDGPIGVEAKLLRGAQRQRDEAVVLRTSSEITTVAESQLLPMFMCPSPLGLSVIDQPIEFELQLRRDDDVDLARQSITLVPHCPDAERDFCMRICTG